MLAGRHPFLLRNQRLPRELIGLLFLGIPRVFNIEIIVESGQFRIQMSRNVNQLMHEHKPKVIDPIVANGQGHDWLIRTCRIAAPSMYVSGSCGSTIRETPTLSR